jgi:hypothetical protein
MPGGQPSGGRPAPLDQAADTAHSAETAHSADNAQTLQGLSPAQISGAAKLTCPTGTIAAGGLCFETAARASTNYLNAVEACGKAGRLLPSVSEIVTFDLQTVEGSPALEWAGQLYFDGTELLAETVSGSKTGLGTTSGAGILTSHPYRCAVAPSN